MFFSNPLMKLVAYILGCLIWQIESTMYMLRTSSTRGIVLDCHIEIHGFSSLLRARISGNKDSQSIDTSKYGDHYYFLHRFNYGGKTEFVLLASNLGNPPRLNHRHRPPFQPPCPESKKILKKYMDKLGIEPRTFSRFTLQATCEWEIIPLDHLPFLIILADAIDRNEKIWVKKSLELLKNSCSNSPIDDSSYILVFE